MDGIVATRKLREKYAATTLPVVGLTADFRNAELPKYKEIGMNDCLGKPIRLKELKETIELVMSLKRGEKMDTSNIDTVMDAKAT